MNGDAEPRFVTERTWGPAPEPFEAASDSTLLRIMFLDLYLHAFSLLPQVFGRDVGGDPEEASQSASSVEHCSC